MEYKDTDTIDTQIEEYFQIGQKLNISRLLADDNESYPSYVKDINGNSIFIDIPSKFGVRIPIYKDDIVEITVLTKNCAFMGDSIVLSVESGKIDGLWISLPEVLEKVQRRNFKRWEIKFPLKICIMNEDKIVEEFNGECFDISGSGIAVSSKYKIPHNKDLMVKLNYKDLNVNLKTKFIHMRYDIVKKAYVAGLKFVDIERKVTDKIHKLGVLYELELRRKGLI